VELGLRLAGYGYPTAFFLSSRQDNRAMLTDNPKFGGRFFPAEVARAPRPLSLAGRKPPGTVRLFVFGESAAMGDPEASYSFARQLERILQARHPDQTVEIVNTAMTAINSHVIREIARDCAPREGDFWLVFAGNNEVIGPFGAGTVFGRQAPGLAAVRLSLALKTTRVGQLLASLGRGSKEPANWEGMELFLDQRVPRDDRRLKNVYANFAANLADIADLGRQSGAKVLFATVPVNLRDSPPFASVHRPGLRPGELAEWEKCFGRGVEAEDQGRFGEALSAYRQAGQIDGEFAQLIFGRAHCELELKQAALAEADFRLARDLDALRFRTDSRLNEIIRQVAAAKGVWFTDAEQQFARRPEGLPGEDLFYDHVHLNFTGNYCLAVLFAAGLEKHWPGARAPAPPLLTEGEVARRLAFTDFDRRRIGEEMRARLQQPPFTGQSNFRQRDEHWRETLAALSAPPASLVPDYQAALALGAQDWLLHANFAGLLEAAGDGRGAAAQWGEVAGLLPHAPQAWFNLGRLARAAGNEARAEEFLREGLRRRPDSVELLTEFGLLQAGRGATQEARRQFRAALRLQPGFSAARVNLGLLLAREGDAAGAAVQYREALRRHTNNVDARINLANLLGAQGQSDQAMALYEEAVKLQPDNALARYNLGKILAANNRLADAVPHFEAALQQHPNLAEIRYELGVALGRLGKDAAALAQFAEAVRLKPELVEARLNYGVALARTGRYAEAAAEFRETLRLRPDHPLAQRLLDQASRAAHEGPRAPPN
jgi:tetratricopeptide (TPR) repeat protein